MFGDINNYFVKDWDRQGRSCEVSNSLNDVTDKRSCSGMWRRDVARVLPDVSKNCNTIFFRARSPSRVQTTAPRSFVKPRTTIPLTLLSHLARILSTVIRLWRHTKLNTIIYSSPSPPQVPSLCKAVCCMKKEMLSLVDRGWGQDFNHMRKYDNGMSLEHYYYCL